MTDYDFFTYILKILTSFYPRKKYLLFTFDKKFEREISGHPERNKMTVICKKQISDPNVLAEQIAKDIYRHMPPETL